MLPSAERKLAAARPILVPGQVRQRNVVLGTAHRPRLAEVESCPVHGLGGWSRAEVGIRLEVAGGADLQHRVVHDAGAGPEIGMGAAAEGGRLCPHVRGRGCNFQSAVVQVVRLLERERERVTGMRQLRGKKE